MSALALRGLTKFYGRKPAVFEVDLDVPVGSFYGLVGPNGAGKTTTLSMSSGLLRPTAGSVSVLGEDLWSNLAAGKRKLGILPDGARLFDRLSGAQLVTYAGLLQGIERAEIDRRRDELLDVLGLSDAATQLVVDYSAGMVKKISLACALVHAPRILLLDEPFEAVDPVSASVIRSILVDFTRGGGTVVVSSHVMDLVQRMCDHVAIIAEGRVKAAGTLADVRGGRSLEDRFVELVGGLPERSGLTWLMS
ncbi:ABC transporter ATP-binding protein [Rarobacter faecitabidus]|uniref:ABC-2 type transport system ATP-binding protein n=1 Tax=Rarobacter faecitabidus TaxID=13243 RepID=A0A542ZUK1_RARFA|nr:ABC transporter ATP-binding protein [Rarobacter faecitabidus]TQL63979.1 ABC-2 type transport system ATP-binding protein [Rarobacter faecitabidus]